MKELDKINQDINKDQVAIEARKREQTEYKLVGELKPKRGHIVWEINITTEKVVAAKYEEHRTIHIDEAVGVSTKDIVRRKGCIYISALNPKNALKRYKANKGSALVPEATRKFFDISK